MWRLSPRSALRCRRVVPAIVMVAAAAFMLAPVSARNTDSAAVEGARTVRQNTIGARLATEYESLVDPALEQHRRGAGSQWSATTDREVLDAARDLERVKLDAELRLLQLQLEHADTATDPDTPGNLRRDLVVSIESVQSLRSSRAEASPPVAPQQGGEVQR